VIVDPRNLSTSLSGGGVKGPKFQNVEREERRKFHRRSRGGYLPRSERNNNNAQNSSAISHKETTTIDVVNIPFELNTIDKLNEHFKRFGKIINIQVLIT
jgi:RNA recognition motif-containing protein